MAHLLKDTVVVYWSLHDCMYNRHVCSWQITESYTEPPFASETVAYFRNLKGRWLGYISGVHFRNCANISIFFHTKYKYTKGEVHRRMPPVTGPLLSRPGVWIAGGLWGLNPPAIFSTHLTECRILYWGGGLSTYSTHTIYIAIWKYSDSQKNSPQLFFHNSNPDTVGPLRTGQKNMTASSPIGLLTRSDLSSKVICEMKQGASSSEREKEQF